MTYSSAIIDAVRNDKRDKWNEIILAIQAALASNDTKGRGRDDRNK